MKITYENDGPTLNWRLAAQAARLTSNKYSGQAANDNEDWPLQKLLRTEKNEHCLQLAVRYRAMHEVASFPRELRGADPSGMAELVRRDENDKIKGVVQLGASKPRSIKPAPKKWQGDLPLLSAIDARRELAFIRAKLVFVPAILEAFEWSVVDGLTLEEIGRLLGAGSKGAKGEARARIFDGFGILDRYWSGQKAIAA